MATDLDDQAAEVVGDVDAGEPALLRTILEELQQAIGLLASQDLLRDCRVQVGPIEVEKLVL